MDRYGISRCFMFCLDEPDRHPGLPAPRTTARSSTRARSDGRLIPFVRLDLDEAPIEEATRCLDLGARGIKLHPRAQRFPLDDERLAPVFALAAERRVPILIHGGRGLPPIADGLRALVERYPEAQLIIAHAGIADLAGARRRIRGQGRRLLRHLGLEPDRPARLLPPGRRRSRSSTRPTTRTGSSRASLLIALRTARLRRLRRGQTCARCSPATRTGSPTAKPPLEPTTPRAPRRLAQPMALARIHQYLSMATPLLWTRQPDTSACSGSRSTPAPSANGARARSVEQIRELLDGRARPLARRSRRSRTTASSSGSIARATFRLVHLARHRGGDHSA